MIFARFSRMIRAALGALALVSGLFAPQAHADSLFGGIATDGKHARIYWALPEDSSRRPKRPRWPSAAGAAARTANR